MKRKRVILFAGLILMFILVGCGAKSQEDVLKDLNSKVESMNGYKLDATMTLTTCAYEKCRTGTKSNDSTK